MVELSSLKRIELRDVWPNEARDFTPWLAENIDQLSDVLGMDLEVETTEAEVGAFSLDVLARDLGSDRPVVIENQLTATDHDHLGKLLTYAARYDAHTVVWLVREFRPEHRAALEWLNQRTGEDTAFFGVVVEAWSIDDSRPAPRFNPIAFPNEWSKQVAERGSGSLSIELSERSLRYRDFFQELIDTLREEHRFTAARKGQPQNWYNFASGFSGIAYNVAFRRDGHAMAGLYIGVFDKGMLDKERNEALFDQLKERQDTIEAALGFPLVWERRDDIRTCSVHDLRKNSIDEDDATLEVVRTWMIERLLTFKGVFEPHLSELIAQ